jgi:hypothetical protein
VKTKEQVKIDVIEAKLAEWNAKPGLSPYLPYMKAAKSLALNGPVQMDACACQGAPHNQCEHVIAAKLQYHVTQWFDQVKSTVHTHRYLCKHLAPFQCYDSACQETTDIWCDECKESTQEAYKERLEATSYEVNPQTGMVPAVVVPDEQVRPFLPEAPTSLCLKMRLPGNHELMVTLRGHDDAEVIERFKVALASLEMVVDPGECESGLLHRLYQAFLPKRMRKQEESGK